MLDSESDESIQPRCSDDESGHLGQTGSDNESEKQPCAELLSNLYFTEVFEEFAISYKICIARLLYKL